MPKKKQSVSQLCRDFRSAIVKRSYLTPIVESMVRSNDKSALDVLIDTLSDGKRHDDDQIEILRGLARVPKDGYEEAEEIPATACNSGSENLSRMTAILAGSLDF